VAVTLCIPPRAGELCAPVRFLLRSDSVVMELTARHRITAVEWDAAERAVAMTVEITDPETARPVDVRIDVLATGTPRSDPRTQMIGQVVRDGQTHHVVGTYLGVVADEN
jgi:YD repeat-containing protein